MRGHRGNGRARPIRPGPGGRAAGRRGARRRVGHDGRERVPILGTPAVGLLGTPVLASALRLLGSPLCLGPARLASPVLAPLWFLPPLRLLAAVVAAPSVRRLGLGPTLVVVRRVCRATERPAARRAFFMDSVRRTRRVQFHCRTSTKWPAMAAAAAMAGETRWVRPR